jgi:hypothetical protein
MARPRGLHDDVDDEVDDVDDYDVVDDDARVADECPLERISSNVFTQCSIMSLHTC